MADLTLRTGDGTTTLRLLEDRSLQELLAGPYVLRVWLTEVEPGVYRLASRACEGEALEAICRALLFDADLAEGDPPVSEPSPAVAELVEQWRAFFDSLREPESESESEPEPEAEPEGER